jgi:hypothetical protein
MVKIAGLFTLNHHKSSDIAIISPMARMPASIVPLPVRSAFAAGSAMRDQSHGGYAARKKPAP